MIGINKIRIPKNINVNSEIEKLPLKYLFITSVFLSLIFLILSMLSIFILPPEIPIFYGLPKTNEQLSKSTYIVLPSIISLSLILINIIIAIKVDSLYLKKVLAFASILLAILNIIATSEIITLVGSI